MAIKPESAAQSQDIATYQQGEFLSQWHAETTEKANGRGWTSASLRQRCRIGEARMAGHKGRVREIRSGARLLDAPVSFLPVEITGYEQNEVDDWDFTLYISS